MKILAVDDDPIILELLTHALEIVGNHKLVTSESSIEALEIAKNHVEEPFDCFLFDIQMPHMDGMLLTRKVRGLHAYAASPILMLTTMSDKRYIDAAFAAGATDYLTKPFELSELKSRLAHVARLVEARQSHTQKLFAVNAAAKANGTGEAPGSVPLNEPLALYDIENVIEQRAMQNYVEQLSRSALFGSTAFAFSIRKVESFHHAMSPFEFFCLISETAQVISDTLKGHQFVMSYAGNGTFVCISESGLNSEVMRLMDSVNLSLARTKLYDNMGEQVCPRVSAGNAVRLVWKSDRSIMEAVAQARMTAEAASAAYDSAPNKRRAAEIWA